MPYRIALFFVVFSTAAWVTGCSASREAALVPPEIPYASIDQRRFQHVGLEVATSSGLQFSVATAKQDTLVWFKSQTDGQFKQAFLRRGNSVYVLGRTGDYLEVSPAQSVAYRVYMQKWRQAQALYAEEVTARQALER